MGRQLAYFAIVLAIGASLAGCGCGSKKKDYEKVRASIPGLAQREHKGIGNMNPNASVPNVGTTER